MSKIVVVVRNLQKVPIGPNSVITESETKEYLDSIAFNNERGELVIAKIATSQTPHEIDSEGKHWRGETIAVFKEWIYWEKVEKTSKP